jgi:hypothetical protein
MAMDGDAVWVASGPDVIKHIRGKEVRFEDHCSRADFNETRFYELKIHWEHRWSS